MIAFRHQPPPPRSTSLLVVLIFGILFFVASCEGPQNRTTAVNPPPTMVLNVISGAEEDPHAVTMALQLAGHALDDGRDVVLFFNVRAVRIPTAAFSEDLAFKDRPIKTLLEDLIERGADVQVCPHCMNALGVVADDLIDGADVTDREKLFEKLGANTVVFTY